ncbi:MAG: hypothetical protein A2161_12195, partial [Candidatus Schekmanbacteria bacterium RBG_13_48_7]
MDKFSFKQKILLNIAPFFGKIFLYFLAKSCRITKLNWEIEKNIAQEFGSYILAFWHGRQLMLVYTHRNRGINVLVSQSFDGELITRILKKFGSLTVRGSSSRGGKHALDTIISLLQSNKIVAFTPDGPRGPVGSVAPGIIIAASKSCKPILPLTVAAKCKTLLKSWDSFMIPHPFSEVVIITGNPIHVPAHLSPDSIEEYMNILKTEINSITTKADNY